MIIYVDIDNTICNTEGTDYKNAIPIKERIEKINGLFNRGDTIIYWTARGTRSDENWFLLTYEQLKMWGCLFNELRMGKPVYDLFIDDKNVNSETYFLNGSF